MRSVLARRGQAAGLVLATLLPQAQALDIARLDVTHARGEYRIAVVAQLDAPADAVRAVLLDADTLKALDPTITALRLKPQADGSLRAECEQYECVAGFCRQLLQVQAVTVAAEVIEARTLAVPGGSFKSGQVRWTLNAEGRATRLTIEAASEPDIWLPPFIGPKLMVQHLREKTSASLARLEQLAAAAP